MYEGDMAPKLPMARRDVIKAAGGGTLAVGGLAAGGVVLVSDRAQATAQVEAEDLEVTTPDGRVEEIWLVMNVEVSYDNIEPEVTHLGLTSKLNGEVFIDEDRPRDDHTFRDQGSGAGPDSADLILRGLYLDDMRESWPLFEDTDYEPSDFEVPEDGTSETFEFHWEVEFRVISHDEIVITDTAEATAHLTIHNEADDSGGGGGGGGGSDPTPTPTPEASVTTTEFSLGVELPSGETVRSS